MEYEKLKFTDDYMFCMLLQHNVDLTRRLIEIILNIKIAKIIRIETQHAINDKPDSKSVRLDVYCEDDKGEVFDVEMQSYKEKNLAGRARYYHSMIAIDHLGKGNNYDETIHSYVIFICTYDPFKLGKSMYIAKTCLLDNADNLLQDEICCKPDCQNGIKPDYNNSCNNGCKFDDGILSIFLNCTCIDDSLSDEMKNLYSYIREGRPQQGLTTDIENALVEERNVKQWRHEIMTLYDHEEMARAEGIQQGMQQGIKQGMKQGIKQGMKEGALTSLVRTIDALMKNLSLPLEDACKAANITVEDYNVAKQAINEAAYPAEIKAEVDNIVSESHL